MPLRALLKLLPVVLLAACLSAPCAHGARASPFSVNIGGVFETDSALARVFDFAIRRAPDRSRVPLQRGSVIGVKELIPYVRSSFDASKAVCRLLEWGPSAIVGPSLDPTSHLLASTCSAFGLPFLSVGSLLTRLDDTFDDAGDRRHPGDGSIVIPQSPQPKRLSLQPPADLLAKAYLHVLNMTDWKSLSVIYDSEDAFLRLAPILLAAPSVTTLRPLDGTLSPITVLKEVLRSKDNSIVLDVATNLVPELLHAAKKVGLFSEYHNIVITSLDMHAVDLSPFYGARANITFLQLLDLNSKETLKTMDEFRRSQLVEGVHENLNLTTEQALLIDSVSFVSRTLHELSISSKLTSLPQLNCRQPQLWQAGDEVVERILQTSFRGLTGAVTLDQSGFRSWFQLNVMRVMPDGVVKVATWDSEMGLRMHASYSDTRRKELENLMASKVFRVSTIVNPPYTMLKADHENRTGNDRFEGFCMDLMATLAEKIGFRYKLHLVKDNKYGNLQPDGSFNGMIREVMDLEADMAIVDLSINAERIQVVDFTHPFLRTGISILYRHAPEKPVSMFLFMGPFSVEVWICTLTAFVGSTVFYYLTATISPTENRELDEDEELTDYDMVVLNQEMKLMSRFWFTIGSIMQQGCDLNPVSMSCRILASVWWFFTLIVISSYTANLAASLTAARLVSEINSAQDLAGQSKVYFGCLASGSTRKFFEQSSNTLFQHIAYRMKKAKIPVFTGTNEEGVKRVILGNYAFFMESTTIEYQMAQDCRLTMVGGKLDSKGYGIAIPVGSPMRKVLSEEILRLAEREYFLHLKKRWWTTGITCPPPGPPPEELGIRELAGVFLVLLIGALLGIVIMVGEFLWEASYTPFGQRSYLLVELWWALRFAIVGSDKRPRQENMQGFFMSSRPKPPANVDAALESAMEPAYAASPDISGGDELALRMLNVAEDVPAR